MLESILQDLVRLVAARHLVFGVTVEEGNEKGSNNDRDTKYCHVLSI